VVLATQSVRWSVTAVTAYTRHPPTQSATVTHSLLVAALGLYKSSGAQLAQQFSCSD